MKGTVSRSKSKSCGDRFDMLPSPFSLSRPTHKQFRWGANSHRNVQSGHFLACIQRRFIAWQIECVSVCVFVPSSVSVTGLIWDNPYNSALCQGWGETLNRVTKRSTAEEPLRSKLKDGQSTYAPPALTAWHFYSAPPEEKEETRRKSWREGED